MIKRFLNAKAFNTLLIVALLTVTGLYLRLANLGALSFHHDEFYMVSAAKGYLETGDFRLWDFSRNAPLDNYSGSWLYTWLVAKSFSIFGFSEFAARIPGVITGTLTILLIYFTFSRLTSKAIALIASLLFTFDETAIYLSRFTRQYSLFLASYLLVVFYFWRGYERYSDQLFPGRQTFRKLDSWRKKHAINPQFLFFSLAFFLLSYHLQPLAVNFIPSLFVYCLLMLAIPSLKTSTAVNKKYVVLTVSFSMLFAVIVGLNILGIEFVNLLDKLKEHFTLNIYATYVKRPNFIYYSYLFERYRSPLCANLFLITGIIYLLKEYRHKGLYILSSLFVPLLLSIYFWKRYEDFRYIYFLKPFAMLVLSAGVVSSAQAILKFLNLLIKRFERKTTFKFSSTGTVPNILSVIICLATLTFISFPGLYLPPLTVKAQANWTGPEGHYRIHRRAAVADYKKVYKYISQHAQKKDLLIVQGGTGIQAGIYLANDHPWNINYLPWRSSNLYYKPPSSIPAARYDDQAGLEVNEFLLPYSFWGAISQYNSGWVVIASPLLLNPEIVHFVTNNLEIIRPTSPSVYRWKTETPIETEFPSTHFSQKESPNFFVLSNGLFLLRHYIQDPFLLPGTTFPVSLYLQTFPGKQIKRAEQRFETNTLCTFKFKLVGSGNTFTLSTALVDIPHSLNKILTLENFLDVPQYVPSGEYKLCLSVEEVGKGETNNQEDLCLSTVFVVNQTPEHALYLRPFPLGINNFKEGFAMTSCLPGSQGAMDTNTLRLETIWSSSEKTEDPTMFIVIGKKDTLHRDRYYVVRPKPIKQNLILTKDNTKLVVPLTSETYTTEWQKGEVIRKEYKVNLPTGLRGEYEARMVMASQEAAQGAGSKRGEVKFERGDLYALAPYDIYGGSLKLTRENSVESLNVQLGANDLKEGKWTLEFVGERSESPDKEADYEVGVIINGNGVIEASVPADETREMTSVTMNSINDESVEKPGTPDREKNRISIDIPAKMLKVGANTFNFFLNTEELIGNVTIRDIKLINRKRISFDDDNSIHLGKLRLGEEKENDDQTYCNPYHTVTMVKEKPEWVTMEKEHIDLGSLVLLDYTYPEMSENKLCVNLYWQIRDEACSGPPSFQLIDEEGKIALENPLLTPFTDCVEGEVVEENLKLDIPCDLAAGWYKVVLSESEYGKQVLLGKARLKGSTIIDDYTSLTTRDYGKVVSHKAEKENKPGSIALADWVVSGTRVSLKWRLECGTVNADLQFVIRVAGGGKMYAQRYFPQKPVFEWKAGEHYWEDYRLTVPERNNNNAYKVGIALWDPIRENYLSLNGKRDFIHIGETKVTKEKIPDGVLLTKSKSPLFFDETTLEAKVMDQLGDLRVKGLKDLDLDRMRLELLKSYDVLVADRAIKAEEKKLLDEYVEGGGVVIESRDQPGENHVWELINSEVKQDEHR